jgi:hypothetical protein
MVNHATLTVGKGFGDQRSYLVNGFGFSALIDGIPYARVEGV